MEMSPVVASKEIEKVLPWFTWVMDGTKDFVGDYEGSSWLTREEVDRWWEQELLPRVNDLERAWKENDFPPRPGGLCRKYCPVGPDLCEFSGK